jgi:two-component system phosphate regulon sensor histidine kinase PhoR
MSLGLRWRIAVPYVVLILVATLGLTLYVSDQVRQARMADLESQLLADARLLSDSIEPLLARGESVEVLDAQAKQWSELLEARVTIIGPEGVVLGESHANRVNMDNHLNRPEVQQALQSGQGGATRFSRTEGYDMMYAAHPALAASGRQVIGFVRVSLPLREIEANVGRLRQSILVAGLITAVLAALIALVIAERTARPVRDLTKAAERMSEGDLSRRLVAGTSDEIGQLTQAFNHMADELQAQMTTLGEERGRLTAVLDHMADGVLITDEDGQVELINAATARILGTSEARALGRSFAQVVPHHQLIELWKRCRESNEEQIETVEISHHDLFLQAIVTPFRQVGARGYLVILQDLTRIRRLETVRRDFISNISHELRTPLAGLKALVDTLRGGAIKDPPAAKRFLKRMDSEVDSLTQLVQELLELSRVESGQAPLHIEATPAVQVIVPPSDRLRPQAERAGLDFAIILPPQLPLVMADAERMQMVVTNLIHNAVKFTPPGGKVAVTAESDGNEVVFSVSDTGVGIPTEDLPRIFERFYKADRARSGGGTGLGLAIAKHLVEGHGGRIWAESIEGQGSTFFFTLPSVE